MTYSQSHSFDINLAAVYGVHEAIIIHHFQHWIRINKGLNRNNIDGRTWTYQTREEIAAHFPYLTPKQVRGITDKLETKGVIIKGNYNKKGFDKTIWYAFVNEEMFTNAQMGNASAQTGNGAAQTGTPIPDTIPNTKPSNSSDILRNISSEFSSDRKNPVKSTTVKISFDKEKWEFENITEADYESWMIAYPNVAVKTQIRRMVEWIKANPKKSNKKNWRSFINNWLMKSEDIASSKDAREASKTAEDPEKELIRKNTAHFYKLKEKNPEAFKSCYVKNGYVINNENGKEARIGMELGAFETLLCHIAGVRKKNG